MRIQDVSPHRLNRTSAPLMALLLTSTALVGFTSARAQELPTGGSVASGGVTISNPSSSQLSIRQSTNSAIVNWQSFSIGAGATVNIDQPTSSSTMLNRVTGGTKSTISGRLNANGQVFLVNPNGIAISKTGKVSAAGFVASSLDISDEDFKAGNLKFEGNGASSTVSNQGSISIGRGGYAALIGGSVDNAGSISVPLGKVGLGSGERATLDLSGDGFLQVSVPTKADGSNALVSNSGTISADGGTVELKAAAVRDAARQAVNMSGVVEARTVSGQSGAIVLGGDEGSVEITGTLDASAKAGGKGGKVTVTGRKLKLKAAKVDASGKDGGGTVRIGGDKQGSGTLQRAPTTEVDANTTINASATGTGDGGTVIVWSDGQTKFAGKISARGGEDGGNGGFTEVSGKQHLDFTGSVDLRARFGDTGDLLLDPYNVTISNAAGNTGGSMTANTNDSVINVTTLQNQLALANVTISTGSGGSQAGDITIAAPIAWSANTLTLSAYHSIVFNANATIGGVGGLSLVTNNGGTGGTISYALGASATFTGTQGAQALSVNGQSYTLIYDVNGLQAINSGLTGLYALAKNIDASATSSWNSGLGFISLGTDGNSNIQNSGNGFTGTFDGLGHAVDGLSVTQSAAQYVGLFGYVGAGGFVQNVGVTNVTVRGFKTLGGIVGFNAGTVTQSYSTGQLFTTQYGSSSGGLIGENDGALSDSFSTVVVNARDTNTAGGAVGYNYFGTIDRVYAMGAVDVGSGGAAVGGLVGSNYGYSFVGSGGRITDSYSTGAVSGGWLGGAFIGNNLYDGTVTGAYDTSTSGPYNTSSTAKPAIGGGTTGGSVNVVGLSTSSLQNGGASGLSAAYGGGTGGLYPYLKSFYPNGAQAISGIAYKDSGNTPLISGTGQPYYTKNPGLVSVVSGGVKLGTVSTGTNGYYYLALPAGTVSNAVLAYTVADADSGARNGVTFRTGLSGGNISNLNVYGDWRLDEADGWIASLSALNSAYASTAGSTSVGSLSFANRQIETAATTFALDQALSAGTGTLALSSNGTVTQGATGNAITAGSLWFGGSGSFAVNGAGNQIGTVAGNIGSVDLRDDASLTVASASNARGASTSGVNATGSVKLRTTGDLTISASAPVSGANPVLAASGKFINNRGSDAVTATSGRWLVYAANPTGNTFGNLDSGNTAIWNTAAGGAVSAAGNRYVFAYQPTLTFTSNNATKTYGDTALPPLTSSVAGYQTGVIGAYLGDTASTTFSGGPSVTSVNPPSNTQVGAGSYAITVSAGNLAALSGYGFAYNSAGLLTIGKRAVTVTVTPGQGKIYGDANPSSYGYTVSDLGAGVALAGSLTRAAGNNAGTYAINQGSVTNANNSNYDITYVGGNFTIAQRAITVTAAGKSRTYGSSNPALTYQLTSGSLVGSDSLTGALTTSATTTSNVGSYAITQGTLNNNNYAITYVGANLSVTPRAITVTADAKTRIYGDANPALTYHLTSGSYVNGDSLSGALATTATTASSVGSYAITQGTLANSNYAITYVGANLSVTKRAITVTADARTRAYGDANPALTYQLTSGNFVNGDSLGGSLATTATTASGVGSYAITQGTLANSNYAITYVGGNLAVMQRAITVTADAKSRAYGDGNPVLTYQLTSGNFVNGDSLSGSLATTATTASGVGSYAITQGTLANSNYAITYVGGNLAVTQRAITVTADAKSRSYGDGNPALTYQLASGNFVNGDSLTGALATTATTASGVGSYGITQGTLANSNYAINYVSANLSVTPRAVTVTANAGQSKIYGDSDPLSYGYTVSDLGGGTALVGVLDRAAGENVGTYAIGQGTLTNALNSNYDITYVGAGFSIGKRSVTVTANAGQDKTYGDADPTLGYTVSDLGTGAALVGALDRATGEDVGTYAIGQGTLTGANNANYDISYVGSNFSIGKRAITVTATAGQHKAYGNADPSSYLYTTSDLGSGTALVGTLDRVAGESVGAYAIGQGTLTNANNSNYDISYVGSDFTIGKRAITVTANAGQGKTYGDSDPLYYGYTVSDLGNGVDLVGSLERVAGENAGTYAIGQGTLASSNADYDITYVGADFTIAKRAVTVTANAGQGKIYGDADPLAYGYTHSDLGNGVDLVGALDRVAGENVGRYSIGQGTLINADNSNYDITYVGTDFSIAKRAVTVTANAGQGKIYGDADPSSYGYNHSDLGNGAALVGALDRASGENVGNYAIGRGTLTDAANSNYDITYVDAGFSIGKRSVTVTADAGQGKTYGDIDPSSYGYSYSDLGNGAALVGALDRASGENVGNYSIGRGTLTGAANSNYDISYVGADFSIGKRSVTVTANAGQGKTYGDTDPSSYGYSYSYLGNGIALVGALNRAAGENAGSYEIGQGTLTNAANANYDITYVGSDFTIGKRAITVVADAQSRPQGMANPPLTYTIGGLGLVGSDALAGALSTAATPASIPGSYAIEQGSLTASANYELTYVGADLVVSAPNTIPTSQAATTVAYNADAYGAGAPAPVFFTGQPVGGDTQTLVEDPRLGSIAFCQGMAETASVCSVAAVQ
ncbi:MBG domain-containing protein [Mesorhizobium huakuii]|uniref:Filamentous hemagglutinin N-terminal domain-containing protein n=1 Tax=Mesorhizobium huakuii TaxID=28104 RepID=A0A7G6SPP1_9HYPH|nr:MBG domain-containing protein [Mesorhizobium huakuii]QND56473.1 filamentous hemagglutinin N-terminal domain-containing protein [Mesorhizobium huakuii]